MKYKNIFLITIMAFSINAFTQSNNDLNELTGGLDSDYLKSLPEDVRNDLLDEINKNNSNDRTTFQKRPSTELLKYDTVKNWEKFQKEQLINSDKSERYGINLFRTMQSSFMPINELILG